MTTMIQTMTQANRGPRVHLAGGTVQLAIDPVADENAPPATHYVDIAGVTVVGELSKMEQIVEYLKALYR